jgi:hypothetical protein
MAEWMVTEVQLVEGSIVEGEEGLHLALSGRGMMGFLVLSFSRRGAESA